jgi:glucokinase
LFADVSAARLDRREGDAAIGVDVGGTKVAFGLLNASSLELLLEREIPTRRERGGQAVLSDVETEVAALADAAAQQGRRVVGLGLAVPEIVDLSGRITTCGVIPQWNELPVHATLNRVAPVRIEADVRAAAFAEGLLGAGRNLGYYLFLTVGTGISYAAVYEGVPIAGAHGAALNIGTSMLGDLLLDPSERGWQVLEQVASGSALVERYVARGGEAGRAEEVMQAARAGDQAAKAVLSDGARALGIGMALLVNLLDPEAIVVGGGLGSADTPYWSSALRCARRHMYSDTARAIPFCHAELGSRAGVIGAGLVGLLQPAAREVP